MKPKIGDQSLETVDIHIVCRTGEQGAILLVRAAQDILQQTPELLVTRRGGTPFAEFCDITKLPFSAAAQVPNRLACHRLDDTSGVACVNLHGTT